MAAPATVSGKVLSMMPLTLGLGRRARPQYREPGDLPAQGFEFGRGVPGHRIAHVALERLDKRRLSGIPHKARESSVDERISVQRTALSFSLVAAPVTMAGIGVAFLVGNVGSLILTVA